MMNSYSLPIFGNSLKNVSMLGLTQIFQAQANTTGRGTGGWKFIAGMTDQLPAPEYSIEMSACACQKPNVSR